MASKNNGYSLWLVPDEDVFRLVQSTILTLAEKWQSPSFQPHVTLFGEVITSKEIALVSTQQLAVNAQPVKVVFDQIEHHAEYFRYIILKAKATMQLKKLRSQAETLFHRQSEAAFYPHLSLLYGDYSEKVADEVIRSMTLPLPLSATLTKLQLWQTRSDETNNYDRVKNWKLVADVPLQKK